MLNAEKFQMPAKAVQINEKEPILVLILLVHMNKEKKTTQKILTEYKNV